LSYRKELNIYGGIIMSITLSKQTSSFFRKCGVVWMLFTVLACVCVPVAGSAQQRTARISKLSGEVVVSGTIPAKIGAVLLSGDTIETQLGARALLKFSDGSRLELGERTNIDIVRLTRKSVTGAQVSQLRLKWGQIRVSLSSTHQKPGSSFSVETPDALIGVKLSQPDVEISYNLDTGTTTVFTYEVESMAIASLLTGEVEQVG
jgi:hypothetical protein